MQRLLVPVDGSTQSVKAAEFAADLVHAGGGEVILVYVYDVPAATALGLSTLLQAQLDDTGAEIAQTSFGRAKQAMRDVEATECRVELGHPADEIVAVARKHHVSQIVMGSRGLSPIKELLLGSVSERVLRTAHCPVTIVH